METVKRRHDRARAATTLDGHVPAHGPRPGRPATRASTRHAARRRAGAQALELRPRDDRPDLLPAAHVRPRAQRATTSSRAAATTPQTFNSFYAVAERDRVLHDRPAAAAPQGRQPATCRSTAAAATSGAASCQASSTRRSSTRRAGCSSTGTTSRRADFPAGDDALRERGRHVSASTCCCASSRARPSTRRRPCSAPRTRRATGDPRTLLWPTVSAVLASGTAPSPLAPRCATQLDRGAARRRRAGSTRDGDGKIDAAGQAVDGGRVGRGSPAPRSAAGSASDVCARARDAPVRASDAPPGGQYGGWHQYMDKDLRALLGRAGRAAASGVRYCGDGDVARVRGRPVGGARQRRRAGRGAGAGDDRPGAVAPADGEDLASRRCRSPTIQYTNRPSGIHQVMQFAP